METYTKEKAKEWLKMFPHWQAVGCDSNGWCFWYEEIPEANGNCFEANGDCGRVGIFKLSCPWQDTLVTRDDLVEYWVWKAASCRK